MSIKKFDLTVMTFDELWSLHEQVSQVLSFRITSEKRELERRLAVLGRSMDIFEKKDAGSGHGGMRARRKYPSVLPKYRNPQTSETWSGRGKRPRWLVAAMMTGRKLEDFEINGVHELKDRRYRA